MINEDHLSDAGQGRRPTHVPVMASEIHDLIAPVAADPTSVLIDATLGLAGHTIEMLRAFPHLNIIGIDRDTNALAEAQNRVAHAGFADRLHAIHAVYDDIPAVARDYAESYPDRTIMAAFFDLGVSSMQLDQTERGFAYSADAPLDMRMDFTRGKTAADVLATYEEFDLVRILRDFGEERFARRIARAIIAFREKQPLERSAQLVDLIRSAIPAAARKTGGHPGKRTFQALRIEVNDELAVLTRAIPAALDVIAPGGRIAVLSYHSLEDRIVKRAIAPRTVSSAPLDLPIELPEHAPTWDWITRGVARPTETEVNENPRAASARLRAAQRRIVQGRTINE